MKNIITASIALFILLFLVAIYTNAVAGHAFSTSFYTLLLIASMVAIARVDQWF